MASKSVNRLDKLLKERSPWEIVEKFDRLIPKGKDETKNIRGKCFELLLEKLLVEKSITPFYREAELQFIDNCRYDVILFEEERGVFSLSIKTSLRERWKQAEHEARLLRAVYPKSKNYLITLDENIPSDKTLIGLNDIISARTGDFKKLLNDMKKYQYLEAKDFNQLKNPNKTKMFG